MVENDGTKPVSCMPKRRIESESFVIVALGTWRGTSKVGYWD